METTESCSCMQTAWRAILILLTVLTYAMSCAMSAISNIPSITPWNKSISQFSRDYNSYITPVSAAFKIWWFIYFINAVMCVYLLILLFRRYDGKPLFMAVQFIPNSFLYAYILFQTSGPLWISLTTADEILGAYLFLILGVICLAVCLINSAKATHENGPEMEHNGLVGDLWTMRFLVQNAIAVYLGWVCCASLLNNNTVLIYVTGLEVHVASFISLGVLNAILVIWFMLETFIFDRQLRYTFMHYIPFIIATAGNVVRGYSPTNPSTEPYQVYIFGLMIGASVLAFIKIIIMVVRSIKDPLNYPSPDGLEKRLELSNLNNGYVE